MFLMASTDGSVTPSLKWKTFSLERELQAWNIAKEQLTAA
jgi:hypothetical protein